MTIPFVGEKADGTGARHFSYIFGASINGMNYYLPESLKEVIITGGTSIGDEAFSGCSGLTNVTILGKVTYIGRSAFDGCSGLTSVTIGDGVEEIGSQAFYGCTSLSSVNIPNSVKEIGSSAFMDCISLQSIFLPIFVNSVGQGAFSGCSQLTIMCEATKDNDEVGKLIKLSEPSIKVWHKLFNLTKSLLVIQRLVNIKYFPIKSFAYPK